MESKKRALQRCSPMPKCDFNKVVRSASETNTL